MGKRLVLGTVGCPRLGRTKAVNGLQVATGAITHEEYSSPEAEKFRDALE